MTLAKLSARYYCPLILIFLGHKMAFLKVRISEHSEQPFRYEPNTYFGLIRTLIPR